MCTQQPRSTPHPDAGKGRALFCWISLLERLAKGAYDDRGQNFLLRAWRPGVFISGLIAQLEDNGYGLNV